LQAGEKNPMFGKPSAMRGKISPMRGKTWSEEVKQKMSAGHRGKKLINGHWV